MRRAASARFLPAPSAALALALALPAGAVPASDAAVAPCGGFVEPVPGGGFGGLQLLLPAPSSYGAPRNAVIRLSMDPDAFRQPGLEAAELRLEDLDGDPVPFTRSGAVIRPSGLLEPSTTYRVISTDPFCPGCGELTFEFTTGTRIDVTAPVVDEDPTAHLFVAPTDEFCPTGNHVLFLDLGALGSDVAWVEVAAMRPGGAPQALFGVPRALVGEVTTSLGQVELALGDEITVAVTPVDLAGNAGPARVIRTRGRSFADANEGVWGLDPQQCRLPDEPVAHLPETLPANGRLQIDFPFETVPLALERDGEQIALHPVSITSRGQVLEPARDLEPGARYELAPLECVHCVCRGCSLASGSIEVGPADEAPPAAPVVVDIGEDLDPERATGACRPDRTALLVMLEPGDDDTASPLELRYDVALRLDGKLPVEVGRHLAPFERADGTVVLRLETHPYGRLLPERFQLEIEAIDLSGNRSEAVLVEHGAEAQAGCAATGTPRAGSALFGLLALGAALGLALGRRRG